MNFYRCGNVKLLYILKKQIKDLACTYAYEVHYKKKSFKKIVCFELFTTNMKNHVERYKTFISQYKHIGDMKICSTVKAPYGNSTALHAITKRMHQFLDLPILYLRQISIITTH